MPTQLVISYPRSVSVLMNVIGVIRSLVSWFVRFVLKGFLVAFSPTPTAWPVLNPSPTERWVSSLRFPPYDNPTRRARGQTLPTSARTHAAPDNRHMSPSVSGPSTAHVHSQRSCHPHPLKFFTSHFHPYRCPEIASFATAMMGARSGWATQRSLESAGV